MTLTSTRPHLTLDGLPTRRRAPLSSRLLGFPPYGVSFYGYSLADVPSLCLFPCPLFCCPWVRVLFLGSRSPLRSYHRSFLLILIDSSSKSRGSSSSKSRGSGEREKREKTQRAHQTLNPIRHQTAPVHTRSHRQIRAIR